MINDTNQEPFKIYIDYSEEVLKLIRDLNIPMISILRDALEKVNIDGTFTKEETDSQTKDIKDVLTIKNATAVSIVLFSISQVITNIQIGENTLDCVVIHPRTGEIIRDNAGNPFVINQSIDNTISLPKGIMLQIKRNCEKSK